MVLEKNVVEDEIDWSELARTAHLRLNVGCGNWPMRYYCNLDSDPQVPADVHADAIEYLKSLDDSTLLEIYAGHFLEHLTRADAMQFLAESYRVLQHRGRLAIVVPDAREIMQRWLAGAPDQVEYPEGCWWRVNDLDDVCALFVYSTVQDSPHRWLWDMWTLARAMQAAGFDELREIDRYHDPRLGTPQWYQCGIEGVKTK